MILDIFRDSSLFASVVIGDDTIYSASVMGEDKISAKFSTDTPIALAQLDYINFNGEKYQINEFSEIKINHKYNYSVIFEATQYSLLNKSLTNGAIVVTQLGKPSDFLAMIVARMNTLESGWTVGSVDDLDGKMLEIKFFGDNCKTALTLVCEKFGLEFRLVGKQISLVKRYADDNGLLTLQYGMGKGLYEITRKVKGTFFTRVIAEGSTNNIPAGYRGGKDRLSFDPGYIDIPDAEQYGTPVEIGVTFEDIFPQRTGVISSATLVNLADTSINFNLADNFITGQTPYIVMTSGDLMGEQFEIIKTSYNHTDKSFQIKPNYEGAYSFPNSTVNIKSGDNYVFIGINLPQTYIDAAEADLITAATNYAVENSTLDVTYGLDLDEKFVNDNNLYGVLKLGSLINIVNTPTGINSNIRIVSITYPLARPALISCDISDKIQYSEEESIRRVVVSNQREIAIAKDQIKVVAKYSDLRLSETLEMIFDPSGNYFDPIHIKPLSIETAMIAVGTRPQTFSLNVVFRPNTISSTIFEWYAGQLVHYTVSPGTTYTWNIPYGLVTGLNPGTAYYIYARCNRGNNNAIIVIDTAKRLVESDSTYYYFLIGTLHSVMGGVRWIDLSYGTTEINGAFIRTGSLISQDGMTVLNLDTGIYQGRIEFLTSDGLAYKSINVLNDEALSAKAKTDILKDMAFEDVVQLAKLGNTIIVGGYIKTSLLDVDYIRANYINATYIKGLEVDFVRGTIGGNEIASNGILGEKFSIIDGAFEAIDATLTNITAIGGTFENITVDGFTAVNATVTGSFQTATSGERAEMNSSGIRFIDSGGNYVAMSTVYGRFGLTVDDGSNYTVLSTGGLQTTGDITVTNAGDFKIGMTYDLQYKDWSGINRTARYWRGVLVQIF